MINSTWKESALSFIKILFTAMKAQPMWLEELSIFLSSKLYNVDSLSSNSAEVG